jgi:hypothetical protein
LGSCCSAIINSITTKAFKMDNKKATAVNI